MHSYLSLHLRNVKVLKVFSWFRYVCSTVHTSVQTFSVLPYARVQTCLSRHSFSRRIVVAIGHKKKSFLCCMVASFFNSENSCWSKFSEVIVFSRAHWHGVKNSMHQALLCLRIPQTSLCGNKFRTVQIPQTSNLCGNLQKIPTNFKSLISN